MKLLLTLQQNKPPRVFLYEADEELFDLAGHYGSESVIVDSIDDAREALTMDSFASYTFRTYAEARAFAQSYRGSQMAAVRSAIEDVARDAGGDPDQVS